MTISPQQCRAGRILADIDRAALADASELEPSRIDDFEGGRIALPEADCEKLRRGLEALGAVLVAEDEWGGAGVRLKFGQEQARRIGTWESEGGTPGDDEVP